MSVLEAIACCDEAPLDGPCLNADCPSAQAAATRSAEGATEKISAKAARAAAQPRAWNSRGGVD